MPGPHTHTPDEMSPAWLLPCCCCCAPPGARSARCCCRPPTCHRATWPRHRGVTICPPLPTPPTISTHSASRTANQPARPRQLHPQHHRAEDSTPPLTSKYSLCCTLALSPTKLSSLARTDGQRHFIAIVMHALARGGVTLITRCDTSEVSQWLSRRLDRRMAGYSDAVDLLRGSRARLLHRRGHRHRGGARSCAAAPKHFQLQLSNNYCQLLGINFSAVRSVCYLGGHYEMMSTSDFFLPQVKTTVTVCRHAAGRKLGTLPDFQ